MLRLTDYQFITNWTFITRRVHIKWCHKTRYVNFMTILFALEKWKKIILVVDDVEESVSPLFGFVGVLSLYIEHRCWFSLISCSGDKFFRFLLLSTSSPLRLFHSMERLWRRASFFLRDDPDFNLYAAENSDDLPVFSIINFEFGARPVNFKRLLAQIYSATYIDFRFCWLRARC